MGTRNGGSSGRRLRNPGSRYLSITSADGSTCVSASQTLNPFFVIPAPVCLYAANYIPPVETWRSAKEQARTAKAGRTHDKIVKCSVYAQLDYCFWPFHVSYRSHHG